MTAMHTAAPKRKPELIYDNLDMSGFSWLHLSDYELVRTPHEAEADVLARVHPKGSDECNVYLTTRSPGRRTYMSHLLECDAANHDHYGGWYLQSKLGLTSLQCQHRFCNDCIIRSIARFSLSRNHAYLTPGYIARSNVQHAASISRPSGHCGPTRVWMLSSPQ